MMIEFVVPGRPVPMARPRVVRGHAYIPKRNADYQKLVAAAARKAMRGREPLLGAVQCHILLSFDVPKSYTKGKRFAAQHNIQKPVGRNTGDLDNHAKAILDAVKGICWADDSQVTCLRVRKIFADESPRARVQIWEDDWCN